MEDGLSEDDIVAHYQEVYGTSRDKAELAVAVAGREKKIIESVARRMSIVCI